MNFFEAQSRARTRTHRLVGLFALAVFSIIVCIYFLVWFGWGAAQEDTAQMAPLWQPDLFFGVSVAVLLIVGLGSGYKILALRGGGSVVAEMLGGRLVSPESTQAGERRILNVVEEMALASGVPVPPVYLLDEEEAINAFAAGFSPSDAVIALSKGAADYLSRDELQGVVAHEFSHILNGDMKLNLHLLGVLNGILCLAMIGYVLLRTGGLAGGGRSRSRDSKENGSAIVLFGLGLMVVGYIGVFFANIIKSAVSRQREYLADASAVQFTRNPDGIAGALKKIGGLAQGSRLRSPAASQASHLFFASGMSGFMNSLFATHPPLDKRILEIDPHFDGTFEEPSLVREAAPPASKKAAQKQAVPNIIPGFPDMPGLPNAGGAAVPVILAGAVLEDQSSESRAKDFLSGLSPDVRAAARSRTGAQALVLCVLSAEEDQDRSEQWALVNEASVRSTLEQLYPLVMLLSLEQKLPLIELCAPALKALTVDDRALFMKTTDGFIEADNEVTLFEYAVRHILRRIQAAADGVPARGCVRFKRIQAVQKELTLLLSGLAFLGSDDQSERERFFQTGLQILGKAASGWKLAGQIPDLAAIDQAMTQLVDSCSELKELILKSAKAIIYCDGQITDGERLLYKALASRLDVPGAALT